MQFEFVPTVDKKKDAKPFDPADVPTHLSLGNREYKVVERTIDAPARFQRELADHGFVPRTRPSITVQSAPDTTDGRGPDENLPSGQPRAQAQQPGKM